MGIGSEGFVALQMNRKFIGIELKESYFKYAVQNLETAQHKKVMKFKDNIAKIEQKVIVYNNHKLESFINNKKEELILNEDV